MRVGVPAKEFDPAAVPLAHTPEQLALFEIAPSAQIYCSGEAAAFVCSPAQPARFTHQWLFDGVPVSRSKVEYHFLFECTTGNVLYCTSFYA